MTWVLVAGLALMISAALAWPVLRPVPDVSVRQKRTLLLEKFEKEKATLLKEREAGMIEPAAADDALAELERRTVRDIEAMEAEGLRTRAHPVAAGLLLAVSAAGSVGLYYALGSPEMPDLLVQHQQRMAERAEIKAEVAAREQELGTAIIRLTEYVAENPDDVRAAVTLGRAQSLAGNYAAAEQVLRAALTRHEAVADLNALLAEALILKNDGRVNAEASGFIDRALALDVAQDTALYYQGWAYIQGQQIPDAIRTWRHLLTIAPENAPYRADLTRRLAAIEQVASGQLPDSQPVAPPISEEDIREVEEMSPEDQFAFIQTMVQRLALRLEENPADMTGWMRLGQAYEMLDRPADAVDAYLSALAEEPSFTPARERLRALGIEP